MNFESVLKHYSKRHPDMAPKMALAKALGLTHQAVYAWKDKIPYHSQLLIQIESDGKFKAKKD